LLAVRVLIRRRKFKVFTAKTAKDFREGRKGLAVQDVFQGKSQIWKLKPIAAGH
jgi:hypothetical protein